MAIDPKDLRINTYSTNLGTWATPNMRGVEILHVPTGLRAQAHGNRSQHANKADAFTHLKELYEGHLKEVRSLKPTTKEQCDMRIKLLELAYKRFVHRQDYYVCYAIGNVIPRNSNRLHIPKWQTEATKLEELIALSLAESVFVHSWLVEQHDITLKDRDEQRKYRMLWIKHMIQELKDFRNECKT